MTRVGSQRHRKKRLIIYVVPHAMIFVFSEMLYLSQEIHLLVN